MSQSPGPSDPTSAYIKQGLWLVAATCGYPFLVAVATIVFSNPIYMDWVVRSDRQFQHFEGMPLNILSIGYQAGRSPVVPEHRSENILAADQKTQSSGTADTLSAAHSSFIDISSMDSWIPTLDVYWLVIYPRWFGLLGVVPAFIALSAAAWMLGRIACVELLRSGGVQESHKWTWSLNGALFCISLMIGYTVTPYPLPFITLILPMAGAGVCWFHAAKNKA